VNGFFVGDAGDVEKQELFIERPGDFIVAEHLPLEHRRSKAAADSDGNRAAEEVEGRTTHAVTELPFGAPGSSGLRGPGSSGSGMTIEDAPPAIVFCKRDGCT